MKLKEAVLKSLEDINGIANYLAVYENIVSKNYFSFEGKTPTSTVSAILGDFIRDGDIRVKRIKLDGETYSYYLSEIEPNIITDITVLSPNKSVTVDKNKTYDERDLHKLLSSYLKSTDVLSKTIYHEQSTNKENNQIWTHPDMIGIKFLNLRNPVSNKFSKSINRKETFKLSSYEIKKEINNDSELKKAFFQAVSNSSWANLGFLVAFDFSDSLYEELERLNQSFGIGVIELNANPYQSKLLFPAQYHDLDFKTIDKLCTMNHEFKTFIELIDKLMTAEERYYKSTEKELDEFCDDYFENDTEVEKYCEEKHIPISSEEENFK